MTTLQAPMPADLLSGKPGVGWELPGPNTQAAPQAPLSAPQGLPEAIQSNAQKPVQSGYANILEKAVLLRLATSRPGVRKKVSSEVVDAECDKSMLAVSKEIFDSDELRAIRAHDQAMRAWLGKRCLPSHYKAGFYVLSYQLVASVTDALETFAAQRKELIAAFAAAYEGAGDGFIGYDEHLASAYSSLDALSLAHPPPAALPVPEGKRLSLVDNARVRLGELFDASDYPPVAKLLSQFDMEYEYLTFSTPGHLQRIRADIWEREQEKASANAKRVQDEMTGLLRAEALGLVTKLQEALAPKQNDKGEQVKKIFKESTVANLSEWIELFEGRNLAEDEELGKAVQKMKVAMTGVSAQTIRSDEETRAFVQETMGAIAGNLAALVEDAPVRAFNFLL